MDKLEQAVDRVLRGDSSAYREIVESTSVQLVRLAARMIGNMADAEDVVQDAYTKAYRALSAGDFDGRSSVQTWLYRIVVNGAIDQRRRRTRRAETSDVALEQAWDGSASAEARVALSELDQWLSVLPGEQRAALLLQSADGLSTKEIAQVLECSEGAVEQRLVRARAALRERRKQS